MQWSKTLRKNRKVNYDSIRIFELIEKNQIY